MANLPHTSILPPRRTFWDYLPARLRGWLRDKRNFPRYTAREMWVVHSWLLRVMANRLLITASEQKQEVLYHVSGMEDYKPGKDGWN